MNNRSLIINWVSNYREQGIDGLSQMKRYPSTMSEKTENKENTEVNETTSVELLKELVFPKYVPKKELLR